VRTTGGGRRRTRGGLRRNVWSAPLSSADAPRQARDASGCAGAQAQGQPRSLLDAALGSDAAREAAAENKSPTACARPVPYDIINPLSRRLRHYSPLIFRVSTASAVLPSALCLGHRSKRQASHCLLISSFCSWTAVGVPLEDRLVCFAPRLAPASLQLPPISDQSCCFYGTSVAHVRFMRAGLLP
jgi:hypothetical protein